MVSQYAWWLAQASNTPSLSFGEYGVLGTALGGAITAVIVLWRREVAAHERERQRADRLEAALTARNAAQEQELRDAIRALEDAVGQSRHSR